MCQPQPSGAAGDVEGGEKGEKVCAPLLPGQQMLVVPKKALGYLEMELSQGLLRGELPS